MAVISMQVSCEIYGQRMFSVLLFSVILTSADLSVIGHVTIYVIPIRKYNDMTRWS